MGPQCIHRRATLMSGHTPPRSQPPKPRGLAHRDVWAMADVAIGLIAWIVVRQILLYQFNVSTKLQLLSPAYLAEEDKLSHVAIWWALGIFVALVVIEVLIDLALRRHRSRRSETSQPAPTTGR